MGPVAAGLISAGVGVIWDLRVQENRVGDVQILLAIVRNQPADDRHEMSAAAEPADAAADWLQQPDFSLDFVETHRTRYHFLQIAGRRQRSIEIAIRVA